MESDDSDDEIVPVPPLKWKKRKIFAEPPLSAKNDKSEVSQVQECFDIKTKAYNGNLTSRHKYILFLAWSRLPCLWL